MRRPSFDKPERLRGNQFHPCCHSADDLIHAADALHARTQSIGANGSPEQPLLDWFGAASERIGLLAFAFGRPPPDYVARELILGDTRADFALLELPDSPLLPPRLILVEFQGALPNTLFEARQRALLHWGRDFLDGFGQLMDWHFIQHHSMLSQKIAMLTAGHCRPLETMFLLVAGMRQFSDDLLSEQRLAWWSRTIPLGSNFKVARFDDVAAEALQWAQRCRKWGAPTTQPPVAAATDQSVAAGRRNRKPRNNKAALAGRPHAVSMAGAGAGA